MNFGPLTRHGFSPWGREMAVLLFASASVFLFHRETDAGVEMAFLGTRAGLMRSALYVGSEKISNR